MQEPYPQLASAYFACGVAVEAWFGVRKQERLAHDAFEEKTRTVSDLDYQIAELRTALAHHEQRVDGEREASHQRILALDADAQRMEAQLIQLATKFCEPLRARPELGSLFQKLEAEAVAQA
jgi:serine/threonine-protein kinase